MKIRRSVGRLVFCVTLMLVAACSTFGQTSDTSASPPDAATSHSLSQSSLRSRTQASSFSVDLAGRHFSTLNYRNPLSVAPWYKPDTGTFGRGAVMYGPYGGAGGFAAYYPRTGTYARGGVADGPYDSDRGYTVRIEFINDFSKRGQEGHRRA